MLTPTPLGDAKIDAWRRGVRAARFSSPLPEVRINTVPTPIAPTPTAIAIVEIVAALLALSPASLAAGVQPFLHSAFRSSQSENALSPK
jgi:hypothetical protein